MSAKLIKIDNDDPSGSELISFFEACLSRAKEGNLRGAIVILDAKDGTFEFQTINIDMLSASGLLQRGIYRVNTEWDNL